MPLVLNMTVEDLIKQLEGCRPDAIICTGENSPISCIEALPSYYDGRLRKIIEDENGRMKRIEITGDGSKVKLHSVDIEDTLYDYPRMEIRLDNEGYDARYLVIYAKWRQEGLDGEREFQKEYPDQYKYLAKYKGQLFIWDMELGDENKIFNKERTK